MKRIFLSLALVGLVFMTGCTEVGKGDYKEGTYEATAVDPYNNEGNIASAKVVINSDGKIESVYLDTTYKTADGTSTTKKTLKDDYNMKKYQPNAAGEWYEQVEKLEKAIVEKQNVDFLTLKSDSTTDAVAGCTIKVDALKEVVVNALEQAKK